ncbi:MAG TPA: methyltransferase domain-containing protein [Vicinamibacteria bacterium]
MKRSALEFLVCPLCRDALDLHVEAEDGAEVITGRLRSPGCGRDYPIVRGVPRFVDSQAYASSFGFQWNRFARVQLDSFNGTRQSEEALEACTGWTTADYQGKRVLDAGVGAGRYAEVVAGKGGEVVGIDLTTAVDAAWESIGRRERVHLVQADIFAMPFREASFDMAYSIGVLHHTPDTRAAFERVAAMVKPGGGLAVYLYGRNGLAQRFPDTIRKVTTRLPVRAMLALSSLAVPLYYPYRLPGVGKVLYTLCPISMHADWRWRWLDTFDWYTPHYQWKLLYPEVFHWFRENGFQDVQIFDEPIRMRGLKSGAHGSTGR